jgi:hypothetical protein
MKADALTSAAVDNAALKEQAPIADNEVTVLDEAARKFAGVRDLKEDSDYQLAFGFRAAEYTQPLHIAPDRPARHLEPVGELGPNQSRRAWRSDSSSKTRLEVAVTSLIVVEIEDRS